MPGGHAYAYPDAVPGFAEHDLDVFDKVSAGLAWSRSLDVMRKAFEIEVDLEAVWDRHSKRTCQSLAFLAIEVENLEPLFVAFLLSTAGQGFWLIDVPGSRIRDQRRRGNHGHHGPRAICQPVSISQSCSVSETPTSATLETQSQSQPQVPYHP